MATWGLPKKVKIFGLENKKKSSAKWVIIHPDIFLLFSLILWSWWLKIFRSKWIYTFKCSVWGWEHVLLRGSRGLPREDHTGSVDSEPRVDQQRNLSKVVFTGSSLPAPARGNRAHMNEINIFFCQNVLVIVLIYKTYAFMMLYNKVPPTLVSD